MNIPVLKLYSSDYRMVIPMTYSEKEVDKKIKEYNNTGIIDIPINNSKNHAIYASKIKINNYYGINIYTIRLQKIINKYNIKIGIHIYFIEKDGKPSNKCILTGNRLPYLFYYNGDYLIKIK